MYSTHKGEGNGPYPSVRGTGLVRKSADTRSDRRNKNKKTSNKPYARTTRAHNQPNVRNRTSKNSELRPVEHPSFGAILSLPGLLMLTLVQYLIRYSVAHTIPPLGKHNQEKEGVQKTLLSGVNIFFNGLGRQEIL